MEKTIFPTSWVKKANLKDSKKIIIERIKKKEGMKNDIKNGNQESR